MRNLRTLIAIVAVLVAAIALTLTDMTASAAPIVREVETLPWSTPPSNTVLVNDVNASGQKTLGFYVTTTGTFTMTTDAIAAVVVRARGDDCWGAPNLRVAVDNKVLGDRGIGATYGNYSFAANLPAGAHTIALSYTNDFWFFCDRTLFLDTLTLTVPTPTTTPTTTTTTTTTVPTTTVPTTTTTTPPTTTTTTTTVPTTTTTTTTTPPTTTTTTTPPTTTTTTPPGIPPLWNSAPPAGVSAPASGPQVGTNSFDAGPMAGHEMWDNFDGASGANPNPNLWLEDTVNQGGSQTYDPAQSFLDGNGHAVFEARQDANGTVRSGRFTGRTKFNMQYGWVAARIKFPNSSGGVGRSWFPAFWTLHINYGQSGTVYGEQDMQEMFGDTTQYHSGLFPGTESVSQGKPVPASQGSNAANAFHTYWMNWTPDTIQVGVDDFSIATWSRNNLANPNNWLGMQSPHYFILNFAVHPDWLPAPVASDFPARMQIDWVWYKP